MQIKQVTVFLLLLVAATLYDRQYVSAQEHEPTGPNKKPLRDVIRDMHRVQPIEVEAPGRLPADGAIVFPQYSSSDQQDQIELRFLELSKKRLDMLKRRGDGAVENAINEIERELGEADQQLADQKLTEAKELLESIVKEHPKTKAASAAKRMLRQRTPEPLQ